MRIFTKTLFVVMAALFSFTSNADAKPKKPSGGSVTGDLVISKVFYNNMNPKRNKQNPYDSSVTNTASLSSGYWLSCFLSRLC
jgi:hypothetical protein